MKDARQATEPATPTAMKRVQAPTISYLGDRDMFLFLVDGNRDLDDPTDRSQSGMFHGFILRNSDVGSAALTLDVFLFRAVCGNHIIWGFHHVAGFRRRHVGASIHDAWTGSLEHVRAALDADLDDDRARLLRARSVPGLDPRLRRDLGQ
jgi:hypothetical protein